MANDNDYDSPTASGRTTKHAPHVSRSPCVAGNIDQRHNGFFARRSLRRGE